MPVHAKRNHGDGHIRYGRPRGVRHICLTLHISHVLDRLRRDRSRPRTGNGLFGYNKRKSSRIGLFQQPRGARVRRVQGSPRAVRGQPRLMREGLPTGEEGIAVFGTCDGPRGETPRSGFPLPEEPAGAARANKADKRPGFGCASARRDGAPVSGAGRPVCGAGHPRAAYPARRRISA